MRSAREVARDFAASLQGVVQVNLVGLELSLGEIIETYAKERERAAIEQYVQLLGDALVKDE